MKVLFMCTANSCRSILSEAVFNHMAPEGMKAYSAGSQPKPSTGTAIASTATGGNVCPTEVTVRAKGRNSRPEGRVTNTASTSATGQ